MERFKKPILFLASTLGAPVVIASSLAGFGFHSPISALAINWFVLAWIATLALVADIALPAGYYAALPFERSGQAYERAGVRFFKNFLLHSPLGILSPTLRFPAERTAATLRNLEMEMRKAETAHALTFMVMLLPAGYAAGKGWLDAGFWLLLFNALINIYPVMLQRYNRTRLQRFIRVRSGLQKAARLSPAGPRGPSRRFSRSRSTSGCSRRPSGRVGPGLRRSGRCSADPGENRAACHNAPCRRC